MTTFLVVDDSSVIRKIARKMLEEIGFAVNEAEDGEKAAQSCAAAMPDAVLLDWNMPNLDGIGFLRILRASPGGDAPKVVFCTTESDFDHIAEALAAGADEYIFKPFDQHTLKTKLELAGVAP
jgi:two-component system chemotaxis response regulator CheY